MSSAASRSPSMAANVRAKRTGRADRRDQRIAAVHETTQASPWRNNLGRGSDAAGGAGLGADHRGTL